MLLIPIAAGLGVGPVQVYKVFDPGAQVKVLMYVFNNEAKDLEFTVSAEGEFSDFISFEQTDYAMSPDDESTEITYTINFPEEMKPGQHAVDIKVTEKPGEGAVVASQSHVSYLRIQAPYADPYAEAKFVVRGGDSWADFDVYIYNFGEDPLVASSEVHSEGNVLDLGSKEVQPMGEAMLTQGDYFVNGTHNATAYVRYAGKEIVLEKEFDVGEPYIEILSIDVEQFNQGDVAPINIRMKNRHNRPLEAYAVVSVAGQDVQTETFTLQKEGQITAYWDSAGQKPGSYPATLTLYYGGETSKEFEIVVAATKKNRIFAYVLIVLLAAWMVFWIYRTIKNKRSKV